MFLNKLFLALLLAPAVLTSPIAKADVETTSPVQTPNDIFRRNGHAAVYYRPNFHAICTSRGYREATYAGRRCARRSEFEFRCFGNQRPLTVEQDVCDEGYFCLETEINSLKIATPTYQGIKDVLCMHWDYRIVRYINSGDAAGITALSNKPKFGVGHVYGSIELYGNIAKTHPTLEFDMISDGESHALGQKVIGNDENTGNYRVYTIEANYEDSARFAGLVKDLSARHGQIAITMALAWFQKPLRALEMERESAE